MKVSREQAAANRAAVVKAASRLFRSHGFDGVGVAEITRAAGLTHGGFYGQFASKDALAEEACDQAFAETVNRLQARLDEPGGRPSPTARRLPLDLASRPAWRRVPDGRLWQRDRPPATRGADAIRSGRAALCRGVGRGSRNGWRRYRAAAPSPGHSSRAGGRSYTGARHGTRGSRAIRRAVGRLETRT